MVDGDTLFLEKDMKVAKNQYELSLAVATDDVGYKLPLGLLLGIIFGVICLFICAGVGVHHFMKHGNRGSFRMSFKGPNKFWGTTAADDGFVVGHTITDSGHLGGYASSGMGSNTSRKKGSKDRSQNASPFTNRVAPCDLPAAYGPQGNRYAPGTPRSVSGCSGRSDRSNASNNSRSNYARAGSKDRRTERKKEQKTNAATAALQKGKSLKVGGVIECNRAI